MPVPQDINFLVGWASCPPVKGLLTMMQELDAQALSSYNWL
ncbi:MAG: hypothetical protein QQW96_04455 [Tychonema bourrellyi B0820]|nr:hypothetical protein [Tychonema bourrellyi]MDQ2096880.1 hypothetical protein [Tychonema bourrellyi B0820]